MPETSSVDERIVEAKFDATKFEKGVNKTIKKLDELKDSLNMKDSSKSITDLANETSKATERASTAIDQLNNRLTTFAGMIKQKFLSGLADQFTGVFFKIEHSVLNLARTLSSQQVSAGLSKYEDMLKSVRTIVSSKTGEAAISEAIAYKSIEELGAYADQTSYSLNQMTDAMSKMVAAGTGIEDATQVVQGIANACAIAGINATDASRAFFNLSQAYSSGFLKYTDYRSLQLLNMTNERFENTLIQAAMDAGTLKGTKKDKDGNYIAWKTKKNDTNKKVTAGKTVTRKNLSESLKYNFVDDNVMTEFFKKYYVNVEEYEKLMDEYKDLYKTEDNSYEKARERTLDELTKKYGKLAVEAFVAGREARSFNDVLLTLTDTISRNWSESFELIFGKLEKAADFFTWLTESEIADFITSIGVWRNEVLSLWGSLGPNGEEGGTSGQQYFIKTIENFDALVGKILGAFKEHAPNAQDVATMLSRFFRDTSESLEKASKWLDSPAYTNGPTRLEMFSKAIGTVIRVLDILGNALSRLFSLASSLLGPMFNVAWKLLGVFDNALNKIGDLASPIIDAAFDALSKLLEPIKALANPENEKTFNKLNDSIDNLYTALKPIVDFGSDVLKFLGDVGAFFLDSAIQTVIYNINFVADALGLLFEAFTGTSAQKKNKRGVIDGLIEDFNSVKEACKAALDALKEFFDALLGDFRELLGLNDKAESKDGNVTFFSRVQNFFDTNQFLKDADAWLKKAQEDVKNWIESLPQKVHNFAEQIYKAIFGLFYTKDSTTLSTGERREWYKETDLNKTLTEWYENIKKQVKEFVESIPKKIQDLFNEIPNLWNTITSLIFGDKGETATESKTTKTVVDGKQIATTFDEWLEQVKTSIDEFIKSIPTRLSDLGTRIREAIYGIFYIDKEETIDSGSNVAGRLKVKKTVETPFKKWLDERITNIRTTAEEFIKSIPTRLSDLAKKIYDTIYGIFYTEETVDSGSDAGKETKTVETPFKKQLDELITNVRTTVEEFIKSIPTRLSDLGTRIREAIYGIFYTDTEEKINSGSNVAGKVTAKKKVATPFKKWLDEIKKNVTQWFKKLPTITLSDVFNRIFFKDGKDDKGNDIKEKTGFTAFLEGLFGEEAVTDARTRIDSYVSKVSVFIENFKTTIVRIFDRIKTAFSSGDILSNIKGVFEDILNFIGSIFTGSTDTEINSDWLANTVANAITWIRTKAEEAWPKVKEFIASIPTRIVNLFTGKDSETKGAVNKDVSPIGTAIKGFGESIGKFIQDLPNTILTFIQNAIDGIGYLWDNLYNSLLGKETDADLKQGVEEATKKTEEVVEKIEPNDKAVEEQKSKWDTFVENLGTTISGAFEKLPTWIVQGLDLALKGINWAINGITGLFDNKDVPIEETLSKETGDIVKQIEKGTAVDVDKAEGSNTFAASIVELGKTLYNIITVTIPQFITAGVDKVKEIGSSLWTGLGDIFTQWSKQDGLKGEIGKFGLKLQEWIENLKVYVKQGIAAIRKWFTNDLFKAPDPQTKSGPPVNPDLDKIVADMFGDKKPKDKLREKLDFSDVPVKLPTIPLVPPEQKTELDKENTSFFDTFVESFNNVLAQLGEYVKEAFVMIGPYIIEGWSNTIAFIGKTISNVGQLVSGEKSIGDLIDEIFGEGASKRFEEPINNLKTNIEGAMSDLGETFNVFTGGKGLGGLGELLTGDGSIFSVFNTVVEETKDTTDNVPTITPQDNKKVNGLSSIIDGFGNVLGTISNFAQGIGGSPVGLLLVFALVLHMLSNVLSEVKDTITFSDEIEKIGYTIKWAGFALLIGGLISLFDWVKSLVNEGDQKKINQAISIMNSLQGFLWAFVGIMGAKGLTEAFGWLNNREESRIVKSADAGEAVTGALTHFVDKISQSGEHLATGLEAWLWTELGGNILNSVTDTITKIFKKLSDTAVTISDDTRILFSNMQSAYKYINDTSDFIEKNNLIEEVGKVLSVFTEINKYNTPENQQAAKDVPLMITDISGALALFKQSFTTNVNEKTHFTGMMQAFKDLLEMKEQMTIFAEFSKTSDYNQFKYAITSLGVAMSMFDGMNVGTLDPTNTKGLEDSIAFLKLVFGNDEVKGLAKLINPEGLPDQKESLEAAEKLGMLATAIGMIGVSSKDLTKQDGENIQNFFDAISEIKVKDENESAEIALRLATLGNALASFATDISGLTTDGVEKAKDVVGMTLSLAKALDQLAGGSGLVKRVVKLFTGSMTIQEFGKQLKSLGPSLREFMTAIDFDDEGKKIEYNAKNIETVGLLLSRIGIAFGTFTSSTFDATMMKTLTENIVDLGTNLRTAIKGIQQDTSIDYNDIGNVESAFRILIYITSALKQLDILTDGSNIFSQLDLFSEYIDTVVFTLMEKLNLTIAALYKTYMQDNKEIDVVKFGRFLNSIAILLGNAAQLVATYQTEIHFDYVREVSDNFMDNVIAVIRRLYERRNDINIYLQSFDEQNFNTDGLANLNSLISLIKDVMITLSKTDVIIGMNEYITYGQMVDEMLSSMLFIDWSKLDLLAKDIAPYESKLDLVKKGFDVIATLSQIIYNFGASNTDGLFGVITDSINRVSGIQSIITQIGMLDLSPLRSVFKQLPGLIINSDEQSFKSIGEEIGKQIIAGIEAVLKGDGTEENPSIQLPIHFALPKVDTSSEDGNGLDVSKTSGMLESIGALMYIASILQVLDEELKSTGMHFDIPKIDVSSENSDGFDESKTSGMFESIGALMYIASLLQYLDEELKLTGMHFDIPKIDVSSEDGDGLDESKTSGMFESIGALMYIASLLQYLDEELKLTGMHFDIPKIDVSSEDGDGLDENKTSGMFESVGALIYIASLLQALSGMTDGADTSLVIPSITMPEGDESGTATSVVDYLSSILLTEEQKASITELGKSVGKLVADGIQAAFDGDGTEENPGIQIKIRPILDMDDLTSQISSENMYIDGSNGSMTVNLSTDTLDRINVISTQISESNSYLSTISTRVTEFNDRLDNLARAINNMDLYLDSGKLVGGIMPYVKEELDWYDVVGGRGGTVP